MFRLKIQSDFARSRESGSLLNSVTPENLNVFFPLLSFAFRM